MRIVTVLTLAILTASCAAPQETGYKPVASALELMTAIIIPTSDAVFGVGTKPPANGEEWTAIENSALTLSESGNLLIMRAPSEGRADWIKYSIALVDAGQGGFKAAKEKNTDAVLQAGDLIYASCDNCHMQFMKK